MPVCASCKSLDYTECNHVRVGKTEKDRKSGSWGQRFSNREQRNSWLKNGGPFPSGSCNGKKNRPKKR